MPMHMHHRHDQNRLSVYTIKNRIRKSPHGPLANLLRQHRPSPRMFFDIHYRPFHRVQKLITSPACRPS
jgi:hypothetical protein